MIQKIQFFFVVLLAAACIWGLTGSSSVNVAIDSAAKSDSVTPVLVELFTSQGCSSCPPADVVLGKLAEDASIIALSYHVDYWNRLGWTDPYSQAVFSQRQRTYAQKLEGSARVYTPQMIVQGKSGHVGSREREVRAAINKVKTQALPIQIDFQITEHELQYTLSGEIAGISLNFVIVEKQAENNVPRGENRGRDLQHVQVVRWSKILDAPSATGTIILPDEFALPSDDFSVVAFAQDEENWAVKGIIQE